MATENQFADRVVSMVQDHWDRQNRAYPLASLGAVLAREPDYEHLIGMNLRSYLKTVLAGRVKVINKESTYGVVPEDAALPGNTDDLFPLASSPTERRTFDREFWNAFAKPLLTGRRLIELSRLDDQIVSFSVKEVPNDLATPPNALTVPPGLIVGHDIQKGPARSGIVYENIQTWLTSTELDPSIFRPRFASRPPTTARIPAIRMSSTEARPPANLSRDQLRDIAIALRVIDTADQQRILVPLDIITKLLSRL